MDNNQVKHFAASTRRILYLMQLLDYDFDSLSELPLPSSIKINVKNIRNSMNRYRHEIAMKVPQERLKIVHNDIAKDQLHDISLIIHELADVVNTGKVLEDIQLRKGKGGAYIAMVPILVKNKEAIV